MDHKSKRFEGRRALVTGGSRGIGNAIAEQLASEGAHVWIVGKKPGKKDEKFEYRQADLGDDKQLEALISELSVQDFDILVNNAGINVIGPFEGISKEDFIQVQKVNVWAPFFLCQALFSKMKANRWGRIVNIASIYGTISKEERASYTTSKAALLGLTTTLGIEGASHNVLANCVSPGFIETDLTQSILSLEAQQQLAAQVPLKRFGKPHEIASLVAWLVSDENSYVTGQNFIIDGGFTRV